MTGVRTGRHQGLALLALLALSLGAAVLLREVASDTTLCGFKWATGLPCPFCGGVRAAAALGRGAVVEAWAWNPAVTALHGVLLASGAAYLFGVTPPWFARERGPLVFRAAVVALLANWTYLVVAGR